MARYVFPPYDGVVPFAVAVPAEYRHPDMISLHYSWRPAQVRGPPRPPPPPPAPNRGYPIVQIFARPAPPPVPAQEGGWQHGDQPALHPPRYGNPPGNHGRRAFIAFDRDTGRHIIDPELRVARWVPDEGRRRHGGRQNRFQN